MALLAGLLCAAAACLLLWSAPAKADEGSVSVTLDQGVINLGSTWAKVIDPDLAPPDPPATLDANLTEGGTISNAAFDFPTKVIEGLEAAPGFLVDATIEISADGTITGTFDSGTGAGNFNIPAQALITVRTSGTGPDSDPLGICRVSGFTLDLGTTGLLQDPGDPTADPPRPAQDYPAAAFDPASSGEGAVVATWPEGLPSSTSEGGSLGEFVCEQADGLIGGPGGIWLSGTATASSTPVELPPGAVPQITSDPDDPTTATDATFEFEQGAGETEPVTGFQCRLDSASSSAWEDCGSGTSGSASYSSLAIGDHKFDVRAVNDVGPGPAASHSWTIKSPDNPLLAPTAAPKILSGPPAEGTDKTANFTFEKGAGETQPVTGFQCRLDSGAWSACDSGSASYPGLAVGDHTFEVRAGNAAGLGPAASASWKVKEQSVVEPTCAEDPSQAKCVGRIGALKVKPKVKRVKRGKKVAFKVAVRNSGNGFARNIKICANAPKRQLKPVGRKCKKIGRLAPGKAARVTLKLKVTRKARVGKTYKVRVKANGRGLKPKSRVGRVKIRR